MQYLSVSKWSVLMMYEIVKIVTSHINLYRFTLLTDAKINYKITI